VRKIVNENCGDFKEAIELDDPHKALDAIWRIFLKGYEGSK